MAETATSTRLPDDWRYVEEEHRYAKAIRENYHPNGNHRAIVLVELKDSGWRVGAKRGFGDRLTIDRATRSEAVEVLIEVVKGVVATVMDEGGPVNYQQIADRLGVSTTSDVSKAATTLETMRVVSKEKRDGVTVVDLNTEGIADVRTAAARRDRTQELMGEL